MPLGDECLQPAEGSDVLIHKGWPQRHSTSERTPLRRKMLDGGPGDTRGHSQMPDTAHQNRFLPPSPRGRLAWNSELVPSLSFKDPEKSPSLAPASCKSGEGLVEQRTAPGLHSLFLSELTRGHGAQGFLGKTWLFQEVSCPPCPPPGQATPRPEHHSQSQPSVTSTENLGLSRWKAWFRVWTRSLTARMKHDTDHLMQVPACNINGRSGQRMSSESEAEENPSNGCFGGRLEMQ